MSVTSVDKDLDNLTLTLVAEFDAPTEPGAAEGLQQAIGQMDALLAG